MHEIKVVFVCLLELSCEGKRIRGRSLHSKPVGLLESFCKGRREDKRKNESKDVFAQNPFAFLYSPAKEREKIRGRSLRAKPVRLLVSSWVR